MITCGIIGATGYAGAELVRLLSGHPLVGGLVLASTSKSGEALEASYPNLFKGPKGGLPLLVSPAEACEAEVVFCAGPAGLAEEWASLVHAKGGLFIDLSADFRFGADEATYQAWYGKTYTDKALHALAVYGLPELNRSRLTSARIIGNPGCYPTASTLALFPAMRLGLAQADSIIVDAASGLTGAGRELSRSSHFAEAADSVTPYKVGEHRHTPEIGAVLSAMAGTPVETPIFTPHLAPMGRGIVATTYFRLTRTIKAEELWAAYAEHYALEPFVRVLPLGQAATNRNVRFSNYCDLSVHLAYGGKVGIAVGAIDNMIKGAAGQAVQNMNIALGFDEKSGLAALPPAF